MYLDQYVGIIQTIALIVTLVVLIKYTIETKKLREATVEHNELILRPCITIHWDYRFLLKNIGHSPALNIRIDELQKEKSVYRFKKLSLIEPGSKELIEYIKVGKEDPPSTAYHWLNNLREIATEFDLTIRYENMENKLYNTEVRIRPLAQRVKFISTEKEQRRIKTNEASGARKSRLPVK